MYFWLPEDQFTRIYLLTDVLTVCDLFGQPQDDIWKPDVTLRNSDENLSDSGIGSSYLHARVDNSGTVTWTPFQVQLSLVIPVFFYISTTCFRCDRPP